MLEVLLTVITTFIATLSLNFVIGLIFQDSGFYSIGYPVKMGESFLLPVRITNYSNKTITDLRFSTPSYIDVNKIIVSKPLNISKQPQNLLGNFKQNLVLDIIESKESIQLFFPLNNIDDVKYINFLNANEKRINYKKINKVNNPLWSLLVDKAINSIIYSILIGIFSWYLFTIVEKKVVEVKNFKDDLEKLKDETSRVKIETQERFTKHRLLLLARISDYSKELSFWRYAIKQMLLEKNTNVAEADKMLENVTKYLKTYSTLNTTNQNELDNIMHLTKMVMEKK